MKMFVAHVHQSNELTNKTQTIRLYMSTSPLVCTWPSTSSTSSFIDQYSGECYNLFFEIFNFKPN